MKNLFSAAAIALCLLSPAQAHTVKLGDLEIDHPHSFETAPRAVTAAGYMTLMNAGDSADTLIDAKADFARVELHKTEKNDAGAMQMVHQDAGIEIPAGGMVSFVPGGYHIMFIDIDAQFVEGESRLVTLVFEKAGEVEVDFKVAARSGHGNADHGSGKMDHGAAVKHAH